MGNGTGANGPPGAWTPVAHCSPSATPEAVRGGSDGGELRCPGIRPDRAIAPAPSGLPFDRRLDLPHLRRRLIVRRQRMDRPRDDVDDALRQLLHRGGRLAVKCREAAGQGVLDPSDVERDNSPIALNDARRRHDLDLHSGVAVTVGVAVAVAVCGLLG